MRQFVGIDLGKEPVPDEGTILQFRQLMERNNLGDELFRLVNVYLAENGDESANRYKSKVPARVEHIFGVMKRQFGYNKLRYRGLDKNAHRVFTKCALINLVIAKRPLMAALAG